ncbi:MAG TPA: hypothetical protein EYM38_02665 [Dehalococcoidia bacterium]|nr:hypothetical protein [Dehalococcoidia bacterium]
MPAGGGPGTDVGGGCVGTCVGTSVETGAVVEVTVEAPPQAAAKTSMAPIRVITGRNTTGKALNPIRHRPNTSMPIS